MIHLKQKATFLGKGSKIKKSGLTLLEVLITGILFSIVSLGIINGVLLAQRYAQSNLSKTITYLTAMSYFEQLLMEVHPYELSPQNNYVKVDLVDLESVDLSNPKTFTLVSQNVETPSYDTKVKIPVTTKSKLDVDFDLHVENASLYATVAPNLPEGFQSLHLRFRWNSPNSIKSDKSTWLTEQLYAIRPLFEE